MTKAKIAASLKLLALFTVLGATGAVSAKTIDLGTVDSGTASFTERLDFGATFTDYVTFGLTNTSQVNSFIKSFDLSIFSFDVLGIDNFSATLQQLGQGGFQTLATLSSGPMSFDELLTPGQYRIKLNGVASGFFGGLYSGSLQVAAVPEAETWVMLLVGFGLVVYQLRRKQRSLEQQPLLAA
jgi:hypothetical protein